MIKSVRESFAREFNKNEILFVLDAVIFPHVNTTSLSSYLRFVSAFFKKKLFAWSTDQQSESMDDIYRVIIIWRVFDRRASSMSLHV